MHWPIATIGESPMMEKRQLTETLNIAIANALANVHTATIAKVVAVSSTTIDVQPVINRVVDGRSIELPVFTKVPPVFMQGGGSYTAHPIAAGDYCLLVLTERCFDRWYEGQDNQPPAEFRMHDYSDGLAIVGVNPRAGAITIPSVITHIGDAYQEGDYEHQGNRDQTGNYTHTGNVVRQGTRTQTGDDAVTGNIAATQTVSAANFTGVGGGTMQSTVDMETSQNMDAGTFSVGGQAGASGTFTTADSKTVTVVNGLITSIV